MQEKWHASSIEASQGFGAEDDEARPRRAIQAVSTRAQVRISIPTPNRVTPELADAERIMHATRRVARMTEWNCLEECAESSTSHRKSARRVFSSACAPIALPQIGSRSERAPHEEFPSCL